MLRRLFWLYVNNKLGEEDRKVFFRLMSDPDNDHQTRDLLQELWNETQVSSSEDEDLHSRRRVAKVMDKIHENEEKIKPLWRPWITIAASILFLVIPTWLFLKPDMSSSLQADRTLVSAAFGERKKVLLADSSVAYLNAGSQLSYEENFNDVKREVSISGEVFFDVRKNPEKPFIVRHDDLYVKVLGTSFTVRAFNDEARTRVVVATGRVEVGQDTGDGKTKILEPSLMPGEELLYDTKNRSKLVTSASDIATVFLWKDGVISFHDRPFSAVADELEKWYGIQIRFSDNGLKHYRFTGSFENLPIDQVLNLLRKTAPFEYTIRGKTIVITEKVVTTSDDNSKKEVKKEH